MVLDGEILQLPLTQLLTNHSPMARAVQVQPQKIGFGPLPLADLTGLLMAAGSTMPTLTLHLLTQVFLELQGKASLTSAQPLSHPLEVMRAHSRLRQFPQQRHQRTDRLLKLISTTQIAISQGLLDLPVEPERCLIQQRPVIASAVVFKELIRILTRGQVKNPQLQLALKRELLHLTDRSIRRTNPSTISIEIEHDALAVGNATQLGDLLTAEGRPERGHRIGDSGSVKGDDIEIPFNNHGAVILSDGIGCLIKAKEVFSLLKHLCFWGVEILRLAAIEAATAKTDHTPLTVVNRHDDAMTKTVVEPITSLTRNHQSSRFEQFRSQSLHLLQMLQQAIPLIRGITQFKCVLDGRTESTLFREVVEGLLTSRTPQLTAKPAGSEGQSALELVATRELLA